MSEPITSSEKLRRLNIARDLFDGLLKDDDDYPPGVRKELERDLADCDAKIDDLKSLETANKNKQAASSYQEEINILEIDNSYFITNYQIEFYCGLEGKKGKLIFDKKYSVGLSGIHNDMFLKLFNALKESWDTSLPKDIGWVSNDEFRESVSRWKKKLAQDPNFEVGDTRITTVINRMNDKIKEAIGVKLIENGQPFLMEKHYRLRINTGHINMPD